MKKTRQSSLGVYGMLMVIAGCSAETKPPPITEEPPPPACVSVDESICLDGEVRYCLDGQWVFGPAEPCPSGQVCRVTACEAVPEEMVAQAAYIEQYVADRKKFDINAETDVNYEYLAQRETRRFYLSDGSLYAFISAIYGAAIDIPNGHTLLGFGPTNFSACFSRSVADIGFTTYSYYGACARPYQNGANVTYVAKDNNPLGLSPGDWIYGLRRGAAAPVTGDEFVELLRRAPKCGSVTPSPTALRALALADIFAVVLPGDTLLVKNVSGQEREVAVGAPQGEALDCLDPFARPEAYAMFHAYQRPDGVVVLVLPTLASHPAHPFPAGMTVETYRDWIAARRGFIADAIAKFTGIEGLVIDARGNSGGSQELGMSLIARLPNTTAGAGICKIRVPESSPAAFTEEGAYLLPYAELTGDQMPAPLVDALPVGTNVAVVVDHGTYSAGGWLAYYAQQKGIPVVGTPHAGAYGFGGGAQHVRRNLLEADGAPTNILSRIAGSKCFDADNVAMEGLSSVDHAVELLPADVAVGRDTQIEAAVEIVLTSP